MAWSQISLTMQCLRGLIQGGTYPHTTRMTDEINSHSTTLGRGKETDTLMVCDLVENLLVVSLKLGLIVPK